MSYILDALRKADAQRVRDPARGIHALPAGNAPVRASRSRQAEKAMWGAAILVLCIAAWLWFTRNDVPAPAATAALAPAVSPDRPSGAVLPNHSPPSFATGPATAVLPPPPPVVVAPRAAPVAPVAPAGLAAPPAPGPGAAPGAGPLPPTAAARTAPAQAATPAGNERIYNFADLPADVQQAFPKLAVSGGVYSTNVAQRMLIVNGQVFNEGSELAPGVVLEQMRPKSAVLRFRGMRVAQPY